MATIHTHTLGFPRIGARRELTAALESYWSGSGDAAALEETGRMLRERHWQQQAAAGLNFVTVGDFAFYDQVANHIELFGCAPDRFGFDGGETALERDFAMARGGRGPVHALDKAKWFDTIYHYLVPEFASTTTFTLDAAPLLAQVAQARALGHAVKVALIGPLTFLWLGKAADPAFERLDLIDQLTSAYCTLLSQLKDAGAQWVQVDEPILGLDLAPAWRNAFERCYWHLSQAGAQLMLATYFSPLEENLSLACRLPVAGLHVDGVRARHELVSVCDWLPVPKVLSVGIVDGRNIWRTDLDQAISMIAPLLARRGGALWLAPSCSLLHVPFSLAGESDLDAELASWMAFAAEKLDELAVLKAALAGDGASAALAVAREAIARRARSTRVHSDFVAQAVASLAHGQAARTGLADDIGEQHDGVAFTRSGWVQVCASRSARPPVIFGDVAQTRALTAHWSGGAGATLTGPVTMLQRSFVREDQPQSLTALQIALAMRAEVAQLKQAGSGSIVIDEPALREGLPLRRARRDDYLAWARRALRVAAI